MSILFTNIDDLITQALGYTKSCVLNFRSNTPLCLAIPQEFSPTGAVYWQALFI